MDRPKLLALTAKAAKLLEQWLQGQDGAMQLFANYGNLLQRLPAINARRNYDGLLPAQELDELQNRVVAKQLGAMSRVLDRLRASMDELAEVVRLQEKLCLEAWAVLGTAPAAASCASAGGGVASPAQMVEAIEDAWYMCRDELCLKLAITSQLSFDTPEAEFEELQRVFCACVNVNKTSPSFLLLQNQAFTTS